MILCIRYVIPIRRSYRVAPVILIKFIYLHYIIIDICCQYAIRINEFNHLCFLFTTAPNIRSSDFSPKTENRMTVPPKIDRLN